MLFSDTSAHDAATLPSTGLIDPPDVHMHPVFLIKLPALSSSCVCTYSVCFLLICVSRCFSLSVFSFFSASSCLSASRRIFLCFHLSRVALQERGVRMSQPISSAARPRAAAAPPLADRSPTRPFTCERDRPSFMLPEKTETSLCTDNSFCSRGGGDACN